MQERVCVFVSIFFLLFIPGFLCDDGDVYVIYGALNKTYVPNIQCPGEAFNCGNIGYISYPFWGGNRGVECGVEGFQIICDQANRPLLNISSLTYTVEELDFSTNTLTVARQDLRNTTCPNPNPNLLYNSTLNFSLFKYPPKSDDDNVTLYYDCSAAADLTSLPNTFRCTDETETINLFTTGNSPGTGIKCRSSIFVPVNKAAAQSLAKPTASSINMLRSALSSGFSIQWSYNRLQRQTPFYNIRAAKDRRCDYNNICTRNSDEEGSVPSPAPQEHQGRPAVQTPRSSAKGIPPPVQSPGYASESPSYYRQAGKGLPPAYPPRSFGPEYPLHGYGSSAGKSPKQIIIGVAVSVVGGVIILCIGISFFLKRKHSTNTPKSNPECKQDVKKFLLQNRSLTPKKYKYSEIKKITKSLSDKLGQGGYGSVYKGTLPDGRPVAVKVLIETDSNGEEFINEVASISRTSHVNIVSLLGFCHDQNKRAIVYEFMPNKSLDKFLNSTHCCLDLDKLYQIAVGIARGLEYLHTGCTTRIVHFDIKPQNILLDDDFCPKISDFGLAKLCKKQQSILSVLGTRGTIGYIAPEVFSRNFGGVSHKSDVYSYGMMLLEMAGARKISEAQVMIQSSESYFPDKIYEQVIIDVSSDLMIEEEEETRRKMFVVGFWCIQTVPSHRPSISMVIEMLEGRLQSIQIPPKPFLFSPHLPNHEISSTLSPNVETECSDISTLDTNVVV